jgi:hypothetical protein
MERSYGGHNFESRQDLMLSKYDRVYKMRQKQENPAKNRPAAVSLQPGGVCFSEDRVEGL